MISEIVNSISGTRITTDSGIKIPIGNRQFSVGERVWTDGKYAFGHDRKAQEPVQVDIAAGSANGNDCFIWCGYNSAGDKIACRIYYNINNYLEIAINFPDENYKNKKQLFAYNSKKFAWLFYDSEYNAVLYTLTKEGWAVKTFTLARFTDIDLYVDDNDDVIVRIFEPARVSYSYNRDTATYISGSIQKGITLTENGKYYDNLTSDSPDNGYFKYYKNGLLDSSYVPNIIDNATSSLLPEITSNVNTAATSDSLTFKFIRKDGVETYANASQGYTFPTSDQNPKFTWDGAPKVPGLISVAQANEILKLVKIAHNSPELPDINWYSFTSGEFEKRKTKNYAFTKLVAWENRFIDLIADGRAGVFVTVPQVAYNACYAPTQKFIDQHMALINFDGLLPSGSTFYTYNFHFLAVASCFESRKYRVKNDNKLVYYTKINATNGDAEGTEIPSSFVVKPSNDCRWVLTRGRGGAYNDEDGFLGVYNFNQSLSETDPEKPVITFEKNYSLTGNTLSDGDSWSVDISTLNITLNNAAQPCFTVVNKNEVIIDRALINKTDNSVKYNIPYSYNTRMPMLENVLVSELQDTLQQTKLIE